MKTKTLSLKLAAVLSIIPFSVVNFTLNANAQVFNQKTLRMVQICNTIMNMQDADPNNVELRIGRRECNIRAYNVQLCTASGGEFRGCWDEYYTQSVNTSTDELEAIIANN